MIYRRREFHPSGQRGQTLVEIMVALGIFTIVITAIITLMLDSQLANRRGGDQTLAQSLTSSGLEAVRSIRDYRFVDLAAKADGATHGVAEVGGRWQFAGADNKFFDNRFTRTIKVEKVNRDGSGNIVANGGTVDPSTYRIVSLVSWAFTATRQLTLEMVTLLTNWASLDWLQTTVADFSAGTHTQTEVTNQSGGEVRLALAGPTWWNPYIAGFYNASGNGDGRCLDVASSYVYLGTMSNGGADPDFHIFHYDTEAISFEFTGGYSANGDIFDVKVVEPRAYLASGSAINALIILDVTNKSNPTKLGQYAGFGGINLQAVDVVGNTAYVGTKRNNNPGGSNPEFYLVNVANPAAMSTISALEINSDIYDVSVSGRYAYLATASDTRELTVVDVGTDPAHPTVVGWFNLSGNGDATSLEVEDNKVYIATRNNASGAEVFVLNVTNPLNPSQLGAYDAGGHVNGLDVDQAYIFLATEITNKEVLNLDATDPAHIVESSSLALSGKAYDAKHEAGDLFVAGADNNNEIVWLKGKPGHGGGGGEGTYATSGDMIASIYDTTSDQTSYNFITWQADVPAVTTLRFQIRTAATSAGLSSAAWVGPDGTGATYYTTAGEIITLAPGASGTRFIQYRAYLAGDGSKTPLVSSVTINYNR